MIENWIDAWHARGRRMVFAGPGDRVSTYEELTAVTTAARDALACASVSTGEVVTFPSEFSAAPAGLLFALAQTGGVALPLAPALAEDAVFTRCAIAHAAWRATRDDSGAWQFARDVTTAEPHALIRDLAAARRPGLVLFSSGAGGEPKGMLHDFAALLARFVVREREAPRRVLPLMHADHIGGLDMLLRALAAGDTLVVPRDRSTAEISRAASAHQADVLAASPTMLNMLHASGALASGAFASVRIVAHGAESMPPALLRRLRAALPHAEFQQRFGTSETGAVRVRDRGDGSGFFRIDDPDASWRVEDGELWLRAPGRALGYLNAPAQGSLLDDGWFRTGDRVEHTADGWLKIVGRIGDIINVGGEKVAPAAVEAVLLEMPEIVECVVRGEASALAGQVVVADVVWRDRAIDAVEALRAVRTFCRTRLAAHEIPVKLFLRMPELSEATLKKRRLAT